MLLQPGVIRLALLTTVDGSKLKTLYLPPPARDGLSLEWLEQSSTMTLVSGSPRTRLLGFVPVLTVRWNVYDDRSGQGYTIGSADGNRPNLDSLMLLLSNPTGLIRVSPGPSAGGFTADSIQVKSFGVISPTFGSGLEVVFTGRTLVSTRSLEVF